MNLRACWPSTLGDARRAACSPSVLGVACEHARVSLFCSDLIFLCSFVLRSNVLLLYCAYALLSCAILSQWPTQEFVS
uniref:Uncharacterized protein n=1 Tax=Romanomermis culicivorax TaxID=13658 RepID=A0A915JXF1_ROMCU